MSMGGRRRKDVCIEGKEEQLGEGRPILSLAGGGGPLGLAVLACAALEPLLVLLGGHLTHPAGAGTAGLG